jgi:hypothetical protein
VIAASAMGELGGHVGPRYRPLDENRQGPRHIARRLEVARVFSGDPISVFVPLVAEVGPGGHRSA